MGAGVAVGVCVLVLVGVCVTVDVGAGVLLGPSVSKRPSTGIGPELSPAEA